MKNRHEFGPISGISFSMALQALIAGGVISRAGWNGKGMYLVLMNVVLRDAVIVNDDCEDRVEFRSMYPSVEHMATTRVIVMRVADGSLVPWVPSQTDLLANDWIDNP